MPRKIYWSICSQMSYTVTFYSLVKRESEVVPTTNSTSDIYVVYKEARLVGISVSKPVVEIFTLITVRIVVPDIARVWSTCKCFVRLHLLVFFTFFCCYNNCGRFRCDCVRRPLNFPFPAVPTNLLKHLFFIFNHIIFLIFRVFWCSKLTVNVDQNWIPLCTVLIKVWGSYPLNVNVKPSDIFCHVFSFWEVECSQHDLYIIICLQHLVE